MKRDSAAGNFVLVVAPASSHRGGAGTAATMIGAPVTGSTSTGAEPRPAVLSSLAIAVHIVDVGQRDALPSEFPPAAKRVATGVVGQAQDGIVIECGCDVAAPERTVTAPKPKTFPAFFTTSPSRCAGQIERGTSKRCESRDTIVRGVVSGRVDAGGRLGVARILSE